MTCFLNRTSTDVVADEGKTVFVTVSRSNGLESAVSVEWETKSATAIASGKIIFKMFSTDQIRQISRINGMILFVCFFLPEGPFSVIGVYQSFEDSTTAAWCSVPGVTSPLVLRLDKRPAVGSSHTMATLYRWQGVFLPVLVCNNISVTGLYGES